MARPTSEQMMVIFERRQKIAQLYATRTPPSTIAAALGLELHTVLNDLRVVRKHYLKFADKAINEHIAQDIATVDNVIRLASNSFATDSDPKWLNVILTAIQRRMDLLGHRAPTKIAPTSPDGSRPYNPYENYTDEQLREYAASIVNGGQPSLGEGEVVDVTPQEVDDGQQ